MTINLSTINRESPFRTRSIQPSDYPEIAKIARCWQTVAEEKRSQTRKEDEQEQFESSAMVSCIISIALENDCTSNEETYACEDTEGRIQGLMMLSRREKEICITNLLANPIHIRSYANQRETGKMRGVGTYLLKIAEDLACQKGKERIFLSPTDSAIPFYLKNGFIPLPPFSMFKKVDKTSQKAATVFERQVA
jgi:hypothetical protein